MIDIHCHILPNTDDGAKTMEDSIQMAKAAVEEGISKIIATPHHNNGTYENSKQSIIEKVEKLNQRLVDENIPLTILPGQETRIFGEILQEYDNGLIQTLNNTSYVFIELPSGHVPRYTEQLLFELRLKGLIPIIVHPERNSEIMDHPDTLYELVKNGVLTQVTASSITGHFGKKIKSFSQDLIEAQMAHFIASDAHNITTRASKLRLAYEEIEREFGTKVRYYLQENAETLVQNQSIYAGQPERIKRKKFLGIF